MSKVVRKQIVNIALGVVALVLIVAVILTSGGVTTTEQTARENKIPLTVAGAAAAGLLVGWLIGRR